MNKTYWVQWAKAAAIGCIGAATAMGEVSWQLVASTALLAAILSVATSVAGLPEVNVDEVD